MALLRASLLRTPPLLLDLWLYLYAIANLLYPASGPCGGPPVRSRQGELEYFLTSTSRRLSRYWDTSQQASNTGIL